VQDCLALLGTLSGTLDLTLQKRGGYHPSKGTLSSGKCVNAFPAESLISQNFLFFLIFLPTSMPSCRPLCPALAPRCLYGTYWKSGEGGFSGFQVRQTCDAYSSTNKGGLVKRKISPSPPIRGLKSFASWPRVFPRRLSDSLLSRYGAGYNDPHHSTKRALRDSRSIWLITPSCHKGKTRTRRSSVPYRSHSHKGLGMATWASPVISEIPARADQRHRKPGREAVPNHSDRDRPTRIFGMTASLIDSCSK